MSDQGRTIQIWFQKSAEDLKVARLLLASKSEDFLGPSVFHSQQCAEKAIKGYLAFHKVRFSKTHDLEILINLVAQVDIELSQSLKPAGVLTKFAIAYRYPEEIESPEPKNQSPVFNFLTRNYDYGFIVNAW